MTASVEVLQEKTLDALAAESLEFSLKLEECQWLYLGDCLFVELVSHDATKEEQIRRTAKGVIVELFGNEDAVQLLVRSKWSIETVGTPSVARTPDGSIRAATVVPMTLKSGSAHTLVHVVVSMLAGEKIKDVFGGRVGIEDSARAYVMNALRLGGTSYWDPVRYPDLEISANTVGLLAGMLKKVA